MSHGPKRKACLPILACAALALPSLAEAKRKLPTGAKPLGEILQSMEDRKDGTVLEMEFKKDTWVGEVCKPDLCERITLDPMTGQEIKRKTISPRRDKEDIPPNSAMSLSAIIQTLETQGLGAATEVEFDDGAWEAEFVNDNGKKKEYKVDPITGQART